jgi:hypothetical protein
MQYIVCGEVKERAEMLRIHFHPMLQILRDIVPLVDDSVFQAWKAGTEPCVDATWFIGKKAVWHGHSCSLPCAGNWIREGAFYLAGVVCFEEDPP